MSTEKTAISFARLVTSIIFVVIVVVLGVYFYQSCNQESASEEKSQQKSSRWEREDWYQYKSFQLIQARLVQLANRGCEAPFESCPYPDSAKWHIFDLMNRYKIPFGTPGLMSPNKLDQLVDMAQERIVSQKLVYLKAHGIKFPSDLYLLGDVCHQVYVKKRSLLGYNPTDTELKQLLPPGIAKVGGCDWKDN